VTLDEKGFVRTGEVGDEKRHALETNRSGVFAIGDVRSGSVKRVAAACVTSTLPESITIKPGATWPALMMRSPVS
jgi:hypothetical protein